MAQPLAPLWGRQLLLLPVHQPGPRQRQLQAQASRLEVAQPLQQGLPPPLAAASRSAPGRLRASVRRLRRGHRRHQAPGHLRRLPARRLRVALMRRQPVRALTGLDRPLLLAALSGLASGQVLARRPQQRHRPAIPTALVRRRARHRRQQSELRPLLRWRRRLAPAPRLRRGRPLRPRLGRARPAREPAQLAHRWPQQPQRRALQARLAGSASPSRPASGRRADRAIRPRRAWPYTSLEVTARRPPARQPVALRLPSPWAGPLEMRPRRRWASPCESPRGWRLALHVVDLPSRLLPARHSAYSTGVHRGPSHQPRWPAA